ncbi:MAG TPA: hypothetical protein VJZ91_17665, partial [Blastocatellia bacterium]|nr:hypothetical protein [Blastocatellia bacterium]
MKYVFRGRLCGYICDECQEPLSRVKVRLYRVGQGSDVMARAVAAPKDTFALLTNEQVAEKERLFIAEAETNDEGSFSFELGEREKYDGEPFEVDVYCDTVPPHGQARDEHRSMQFSITTVQP